MQTPTFPFTDESRHLLAYLPWRTILEWRKAEAEAGGEGNGFHLHPYIYAHRSGNVSEYLREGDVIWLFTLPYYGRYASLPSLYAMLAVEDKADQAEAPDDSRQARVPHYLKETGGPKLWRYVFFGNRKNSRYFPINNFSALLRPMLPEEAARRLESAPPNGYGFLGMIFQQPREITLQEGALCFEFQQRLQERKTWFLSYRPQGEGEGVRKLAEELLGAGFTCRVGLNREAGSMPKAAGERLDMGLLSAVASCDGLLALESEAYWQSYQAGLEYGAARALLDEQPGFRFLEAPASSLNAKEERRRLVEKAGRFGGYQEELEEKRSSDGVGSGE